VIAYVDSSVLLRVVLGQPDMLLEWGGIDRGVTSALTRVECLRTLDRRRIQARFGESLYAERRGLLLAYLERLDRVTLSASVLSRASDPFPTPLGTLDALHLATALAWQRSRDPDLVMATHHRQLATAAQAVGFEVFGS
jgi:predicted nucleic acid-binding protein